MDWSRISRLIAVVVGAGVMFALHQGLGASYWVSIPLGIAAYIGILVLTGHVRGTKDRAK